MINTRTANSTPMSAARAQRYPSKQKAPVAVKTAQKATARTPENKQMEQNMRGLSESNFGQKPMVAGASTKKAKVPAKAGKKAARY